MMLSRAISQRLNLRKKEYFQEWVRKMSKENQPSKNGDSDVASLEMLNRHESPSEFSDSSLRMVKMIPGKGLPPEPPTCCCSSGCPNCVWIQYVEELTEYYKDGGEEAKRAVDQITDESIKAFVKMTLNITM